MEHRCSIRIASEFDAVVNCRCVGVVHATIRDIGLGGMFVETGSIALRLNTPVDVTVKVPEKGAYRQYRLPAWVVWSGPSGAGLMLRSFDRAAYVVLRKLVLADPGRVTPGNARPDEIARDRTGKPEFGPRSRRPFG